MILTIDALLRGNGAVLSYYQAAVKRWESILTRDGARDPDKLAEILTHEQANFESDCHMDRRLAQEIMAVVGITRMYDLGAGFQGHEGDVHLVRLAIERSGCSSEVKFAASHVVQVYGLPEIEG